MTCREFASFIMEYLAGELPGDLRASFERHLSRCRNCEQYLAQYRATVSAGRSAFIDPDAAIPEEVPEDLVEAILEARRAR